MQDKYAMLNDEQRSAVFHTEGPLLILAGAGAGKTRVLTHRIAYLIEEMNVPPYNIMAITFTNKAAQEMKDRVLQMVDFGDSVWVSTFHSSCVRILRRHIDFLGYDTDFSIYDTDDQKTLLKHVIKDMDLDPKQYKEKLLAGYISSCKNEMLEPDDMRRDASNYRDRVYADIYEEYQKRMKANNALDFDDLLILTVKLLRENREVLRYYQNRFRYIMVDEYQDTNHVQFELVRLLAESHKNICVVGDDDQSIYRFRGADIRNILEFEEHFPGTRVVKLEQNYRSTTHILDAANAVIHHNAKRKDKHLWSELGEGEAVDFHEYMTGSEEAEEVIHKVRRAVMNGENYKDFAVLYRTNAQSRAFEEKCISFNVPYRIVGGVNFYQRQEIKDLIAYLKTIANGRDDIATQRIINVPKRGIGQTTIDKLLAYGASHDMSLMDVINNASGVPGVERAVSKLQVFSHLIGELKHAEMDIDELLKAVIEKTGYLMTLDDFEEEKAEQKRENIDELISKAKDFTDNWEEEAPPTLTDFLEEVALIADVDSMSADEDRLILMTLHSSKGLEFPTVFLCGLEDGLFPSYMSIDSGDPADIEEERRLCYVGITRAMRKLYISSAKSRMVRGETMYNTVSRFVRELPEEVREASGAFAPKKPKAQYSFGGYEGSLGYGSDSGYGSGSSRYDAGFGNASYGSSGYGSYGSDRTGREETRKAPVKATFGKTFEIKKESNLEYDIGDRVHHIKFGDGTVLDIVDGKKDHEVTVDFDTAGEKRMFASFAKLKKI